MRKQRDGEIGEVYRVPLATSLVDRSFEVWRYPVQRFSVQWWCSGQMRLAGPCGWNWLVDHPSYNRGKVADHSNQCVVEVPLHGGLVRGYIRHTYYIIT